MKNVNVTIDEETWRAARRLAAERDTSVSALVRAALQAVTGESERKASERSRQERKDLVRLFESVPFEWGKGKPDGQIHRGGRALQGLVSDQYRERHLINKAGKKNNPCNPRLGSPRRQKKMSVRNIN